ncbi:MAG TPA: hypothetical protein VFU49_15050 [Ktedonobacteraceae bacterium]|nr:hypothetical protein [Ktedonobacteraceae bacterium]
MKKLKDLRYLVSSAVKLAVLATLISGFMVAGLFSSTIPSAHAATNSGSPLSTVGHLKFKATVNMSTLPKAPATGVQPRPFLSKVAVNRPAPDGAGTSAAVRRGATPMVAASPLVSAHAVKTNFNGLSSVDSANVNGFDVEPPDQGMCVNKNNVLELINLAGASYNRNGTLNDGPISLNGLFAEPPDEFLSDPRCYFDASTHAWFASVLAIDPSNAASHQDVAIAPSDLPTIFTVFQFDTTDANGPGCPCFGDQPLLGLDKQNVYISTNEFSILGPNFNGAQIYAISKSQLLALSSSVNFVHFGNLGIGGVVAGSVQPAITNDNTKTEFFLQALTRHSAFDTRLGVWAMTATDRVSTGGVPNLTNVVITSEPYGMPPSATSPGGVFLDTGDTRMQQVQFINGKLWGALNTIVNVPGDATPSTGAAWFSITPALDSQQQVIKKATIVDQGYVTAQGESLLYPAIQQSPDGTVEMVMSMTGPNTFPSAVYVTRSGAKHAQFGAITMIEPGVTADHGFTCTGGACRWGDYSAAAFDSSNNGHSIWVATEYIPGTGDQFANWGTRVAEIGA